MSNVTTKLGAVKHVAVVAGVVAMIWGCSSHTSAPPDPSALPVPAAGQGFQLTAPSVPVAAGSEEQDCYFFKVSDLAATGGLPAGQPVNLHRVEVAQRPGSHHMNIFRVRTIVNLDPAKGAVQTGTNGTGECFKSSNWADWPLVANTQQQGLLDWTYPDGVANVFQPDEVLMLQTHFVNASTQQTPGGVGAVTVNFWTMAAADVKAELGTLFATKQSIRICASNPTPTFEGSCQINSPNPVNIIGANGHFHSRGTRFDMFTWDGTSITTPPASSRFYDSTTWAEPPMLHSPDLQIVAPPSGGIWYSCSYQWQPPSAEAGGCDALNQYDATKYKTPASQLDCCYTFGPIVDKNEHCNAFVYYYPKQDNVNCF